MEPSITEIASVLAVEDPFGEGLPVDEGRELWRRDLRYVRETGFADEVVSAIEDARPDLAPLCEPLRR